MRQGDFYTCLAIGGGGLFWSGHQLANVPSTPFAGEKVYPPHAFLGGRFGFFFFSVPGLGRGRRRPRRWPGAPAFYKNNRGSGGGVSEEEAWEGEGRWENVCGEGGGG